MNIGRTLGIAASFFAASFFVVSVCTVGLLHAAEKPFYLTLDPPPAPELSTEEALTAFTLAPDFTISLAASEPLLEDPVAVRWDEHGNLYVAEMRGFMPDVYGNNQLAPVGAVVRLADTDADGRYDRREVLLDKLVLPRAIAILNEGLLIAEPPHLWLCPSATGRSRDIDCSRKIDLGEYGNQPGSVEHAENGLLLGLDNWLYSAKSSRRLRVVDGKLESEPTLFRGQWGIAQDNAGRLFYNTNSKLLQGDAYDAQGIVRAGNKQAPGLGAPVSKHDQVFDVRVNPGVNRAYVPGVLRADGRLNRPTSASGMVIYRGNQFSRLHGRDAFVSEPAANALVQLRLSSAGLVLDAEHVLYPHDKWGQVEFLASTDERFRPVDVAVGPDGALFVVDMYRGIIQDHVFLTPELREQALARSLEKPLGRGRLWRVTETGRAHAPAVPDLGAATTSALVKMLADSNGWVRDTAQRLLQRRNERGLHRQLVNVVLAPDALAATHAIWTLAGRGELKRSHVLRALRHEQVAVQREALRAGAPVLTAKDLLALARQNTDPLIGQEVVLNLAAHNHEPPVLRYLLSVLYANARDEFRPDAVKAAVFGQELAFLQMLLHDARWRVEQESVTGFLRRLVLQGFKTSPDAAEAMLDIVAVQPATQRWRAQAILQGMFEATRSQNFTRAQLSAPHTVFTSTDESLWPALARARRAVTWAGDELQAETKPLTVAQQQSRQKGQRYFNAHCASCHGADGSGIDSLAPPLAAAEWVTGPSERLARIILQGLQGPVQVAGKTWNGVMPGHHMVPELTDEVAAGLITYLHRAWGHTGRAVAPAFVTKTRAATSGRTAPWTVEELAEIPVNTHYAAYAGRFGRPGFALEFLYNGRQLEVKSAIFNGPLTLRKEDHFFFEPRALELEFIWTDTGQVASVRMLSPDGGVVMPRLPVAN